MHPPLNTAMAHEVFDVAATLPRYRGGNDPDYTHAPVAYSVSVTVVWVPDFDRTWPLAGQITMGAQALLVQRASGYGTIGSWGGVTGFVTVSRDRHGSVVRRGDPFRQTAINELVEECGFGVFDVGMTHFVAGERMAITPSHNDGTLHVLPILGVNFARRRPPITINPREVSAYQWASLRDIPGVVGINAGYVANTLPRILKAIG